jgi:hypothetical protein
MGIYSPKKILPLRFFFKLFLLYTELNAIMPQVRMKVLSLAGILSFDHYEIYKYD